MDTKHDSKPPARWTNRDWQRFLIFVTALGALMVGIGLKDWDVSTMRTGGGIIVFGVLGGLLLHLFFGIKVLAIRTDFKHVPKRRRQP